jgi:hypothetical protein
MSGMGDLYADDELKNKKNWKVMSLLNKVEVLDKLDRGIRSTAIRCNHVINESRIYFFKKMKKRTGEALKPVFN